MNFFLYINRKLIILLGLIVAFLFLIVVIYKQINMNTIEFEDTKNKLSDTDISKPKFAINNESKKNLYNCR